VLYSTSPLLQHACILRVSLVTFGFHIDGPTDSAVDSFELKCVREASNLGSPFFFMLSARKSLWVPFGVSCLACPVSASPLFAGSAAFLFLSLEKLCGYRLGVLFAPLLYFLGLRLFSGLCFLGTGCTAISTFCFPWNDSPAFRCALSFSVLRPPCVTLYSCDEGLCRWICSCNGFLLGGLSFRVPRFRISSTNACSLWNCAR
jgi:hypothetical protein